MKRYNIIYLIITVLFSCNDLNLSPLSEGSSENWYSDETEILMSIRDLYRIGYWTLDDDAFTDDWTARNVLTPINSATINGQSGQVTSLWSNSYTVIAKCNNIINALNKSESLNISEKLVNQYIGEARFVRAVNYANLISHFGDVILVTEPIVNINDAFTMSRTAKSDVIKVIYDDFDFAAEVLPLEYNNDLRATKGAAYAFKARCALYDGDYLTAKEASENCINLGIYGLHPDYRTLFLNKTVKSNEYIFVCPRSVSLNTMIDTKVYIPRNAQTGYGQYTPSWDLFSSYLCIDGKPIDESPLYDPQDPFKNRDPRCTASIVEFGTEWFNHIYQPHPDSLTVLNTLTGKYVSNKDSRGVGQYASFNGLLWKKWIDNSWEGNGNKTEKKEIIMRYADVLLMYAEAKIELNEIDETVLNAINKVRSRAYEVNVDNTASYPRVTTFSQTELRNIIRIERRMEFAWEGLRYMDLIRWKLAEIALNKGSYGMLDPVELREKVVNKNLWFFPGIPEIDSNGVADFTKMYEDGLIKLLIVKRFDASRQYLWPIPSKEILINKNLIQNPGY